MTNFAPKSKKCHKNAGQIGKNNSKFVLGSYGSSAVLSIIFSTIMHIKFKDVQTVDDKVIFQTSRKCCKNFNQREITHRHCEVQLWFFHTALCIIATNKNAKFQVNKTGDDKAMLRTKNYSNELSNSRANKYTCSGPITLIINLIRELRVIHILTNFGTNWLIFVDATVQVRYSMFSNSRANNCSRSDPITFIIELIRDLMVMYILTKFSTDWLEKL